LDQSFYTSIHLSFFAIEFVHDSLGLDFSISLLMLSSFNIFLSLFDLLLVFSLLLLDCHKLGSDVVFLLFQFVFGNLCGIVEGLLDGVELSLSFFLFLSKRLLDLFFLWLLFLWL
jgi:hypothetical protein